MSMQGVECSAHRFWVGSGLYGGDVGERHNKPVLPLGQDISSQCQLEMPGGNEGVLGP